MRDAFSLPTIQAIYEAAHAVLSGTHAADALRDSLAEWDKLIDFRETSRGRKFIETARNLYTNYECDLEIDDATIIYHNGEGGHWVMAWVLVPDDEPEGDGGNGNDSSDPTVTVPQSDGK